MADEDPENGGPRAGGPAPAPGRMPSMDFSQFITLSLSLLLVGMLLCVSMADTESARLPGLEKPVETAERVFERNLWIDDAVESLPSWSVGVVTVLLDTAGGTREKAIETFGDILEKNGYPRRDFDGSVEPVDPQLLDGLRARRAVLIAEAGGAEEARADLIELETHGHQELVDAVRRAYARVRSDDTRTFADYDVSIAGDDWIGMRLRLRLASKAGTSEQLAAVEEAMLATRSMFAARLRTLVLLLLVPLAAGLLVLLSWIGRNRPAGAVSTAEIPPPWTFNDGLSVTVRAAFFALAIAVLLSQFDAWLDLPAVTVWLGLIASLPMLWLVRMRLLVPSGGTITSAFGLARFPRVFWWIGFTLAVFAVDQLGRHAILDLFRLAGVGMHWSEGFDPVALWRPPALVAFHAADACVWSPLFLELGFRGLVYATLRCRYRPWQAALLSGALFAAPQMLSLPAWVSITWSGFVYALAFERCRSILPGVVCNAFAAAFGLAATLLFYR